jgi:urease accessory protein
LVSPTLPVGAYAYSQGMEMACERGLVYDAVSAENWILHLLRYSLGSLDLPIGVRLYRAWQQQDLTKVRYWNQYLQASRESKELLMEDRQLGSALLRVIEQLPTDVDQRFYEINNPSFITLFTAIAFTWNIPLDVALTGYGFSWCENQVAAAIKLIPLGQTQGQALLLHLGDALETLVPQAMDIADEDVGKQLPMVAMMSSLHESQYSRLFRS